MGEMLTGDAKTPGLCCVVSGRGLVYVRSAPCQPQPSRGVIIIAPCVCVLSVALLRSLYSSQLPEDKVWISSSGEAGRELGPSWRARCRWLSCYSLLFPTAVLGWFILCVSISSQKILLPVYMLIFGLPQVEWDLCGGTASFILVYHQILYLSSAWTQPMP